MLVFALGHLLGDILASKENLLEVWKKAKITNEPTWALPKKAIQRWPFESTASPSGKLKSWIFSKAMSRRLLPTLPLSASKSKTEMLQVSESMW